MARNLQDIINSPFGIRVALGLGRLMPTAIGHRIADVFGGLIVSRSDLPMVQAARLNQWVVHEERLNKEELDRVVKDTFRSTARAIFDLYHNLNRDSGLVDLLVFNPRYDALFEGIRREEEGRIIVAPHLSRFDIVAQGSTKRGVRMMALGMPGAKADYELQNKMRKNVGLEVVPTSIKSLKMAKMSLEQGGTVITGIDRPLPESKYRPMFFGHQTALPVHHVMLALKTNVPVYLAAPLRRPDGKYEILVSDPIFMERFADRRTEIMHNAERLLAVAESFICRDPCQWSMFYPLWPEIMDKVPGI